MAAGSGRNPILARGVVKRFGLVPILRGIDLDVAGGETLAVLGPNGAGKSTLLKILAGVMRPSDGSLRVLGDDVFPGRPPPRLFARIGYVGHEPLVYRDLTPRQNLDFFARFHPGAAPGAALDAAGLGAVAGRPCHALSRGMLQRLALARATLHSPEVLVLDEPFSGLDPPGTAHLAGLLEAGRAAGRAAVLVTHDLSLVPRLATRAIILARGAVAAELAPVPPAEALSAAYRRATGDPIDVGDRP